MIGVVVVALAIAAVFGWHASKVHMSHGLIPVRKRQLPGLRRDRLRHVFRVLFFGVIVVAILLVVAKH
jgi:hypothetical protein